MRNQPYHLFPLGWWWLPAHSAFRSKCLGEAVICGMHHHNKNLWNLVIHSRRMYTAGCKLDLEISRFFFFCYVLFKWIFMENWKNAQCLGKTKVWRHMPWSFGNCKSKKSQDDTSCLFEPWHGVPGPSIWNHQWVCFNSVLSGSSFSMWWSIY